MATIEGLLTTNNMDTLAIALLAAKGRRHTEIIKGSFSAVKRHRYLLNFKGQLKRSENAVSYEIVTLLPTKVLLPQFKRLPRAPYELQQLKEAKSALFLL